jgi:hypothetical protein
VSVENITVGSARIDLKYSRERERIVIGVFPARAGGCALKFTPHLPVQSSVRAVRINGRQTAHAQVPSTQALIPSVDVPLDSSCIVEIDFAPAVELLPPGLPAKTGDSNQALKIIRTSVEGRRMRVVVEGLAGSTYELGVMNADLLKSVEGARLTGSALVISFPPGQPEEFVRKEMVLLAE